MPNAGYPDPDGRFDPDGPHGVGKMQPTLGCVESIAGRTSVAEQHARGGYMRSETPCGEPTVVAGEKYPTGEPNPSHNVAAYQPGPAGGA